MVRRHRFPPLVRQQWPLLGLIALIILVGLAQAVGPANWYAPGMAVPARLEDAWQMMHGGRLPGSAVQAIGSLFSHAFLHGSLDHLIGNMLFLWIFAALIAELCGHRWMLAVFAFTAATGAIAQTLLNPGSNIPMLGASGTVLGMEGAYLGLAVRWKLPDPHIWPMSYPIPPSRLAAVGVIGVLFDYHSILSKSAEGIAYGAHLGGFAGGILLATLLMPRPQAALG